MDDAQVSSTNPPIVVRVPASIYNGPYRLEWDWDNGRWIKTCEEGEPLGWESLMNSPIYRRW